ncbi:MAG: hypothetical protein M3P34_08670 [Actinomycetota bacterium]|nr:hypothetical protein [Actinomycetota bacterium]
MTITADKLVVRNPRSEVTIPLREVQSCVPGYDGLLIASTGRPPVTAWAVQESNFSKWLKLNSRAKELCTMIATRARAVSGDE